MNSCRLNFWKIRKKRFENSINRLYSRCSSKTVAKKSYRSNTFFDDINIRNLVLNEKIVLSHPNNILKYGNYSTEEIISTNQIQMETVLSSNSYFITFLLHHNFENIMSARLFNNILELRSNLARLRLSVYVYFLSQAVILFDDLSDIKSIDNDKNRIKIDFETINTAFHIYALHYTSPYHRNPIMSSHLQYTNNDDAHFSNIFQNYYHIRCFMKNKEWLNSVMSSVRHLSCTYLNILMYELNQYTEQYILRFIHFLFFYNLLITGMT